MDKPPKLKRRGWPWWTVATIIAFIGGFSLGFVLASLLPSIPDRWSLQVAIFVAVATVPLGLVEAFALVTVKLAKRLRPADHDQWFDNPGAFLGMVERMLFLGSLVAGYPQFIGVWLVLKGIAGWKTGGTDILAGRRFQLYLLNNAVSLAGVGLGWLVWRLLDLPVTK